MNKELVINVTASDIYIALLENKKLVELNKEKRNIQFSVGDIYVGKVRKIIPGLNATFVNIGHEKDAFLHYLDLGPQFKSLCKLVRLVRSGKFPDTSLQYFIPEEDINKDGKINDVLAHGQEIFVQIAKEPISTKGPRLCSEISIPGRNLVLIPFSNKISVSQKITSFEEKNRLKTIIQSIVPRNYGIIVRTVAEGKKVTELDHELKELIQNWENSYKNIQNITVPTRIIGELNRTSAILRDILNESFNNIYVNDEVVCREIKDFIKTIAPDKEKIVRYFNGNTPIFEKFEVDRQIKALFGRTVSLKSGAYLVIEHTEALHVIDVNSGTRSKSETDQETNALEVNTVYQKIKDAMISDRAKHHILPLSQFGLMQITRQRVRPEMDVRALEKCPVCRGTGEISPSIILADEIENNLKFIAEKLKDKKIIIKTHPYLAAYLTKGLWSIKIKWRWKYKKTLRIIPEKNYNFIEYHFFNKNDEEIYV
ncbi:MAG: ribonuclease E/G [Bacteroidia bacterium]|nr:ribonuclease E/G [Bacteroidia bacterium]